MTVYAKANGGISRNTQFLHYKDAKSIFIETSLGVVKFVQLAPKQ